MKTGILKDMARMLTNMLVITSLCSNNDHMYTLLSSNDNF